VSTGGDNQRVVYLSMPRGDQIYNPNSADQVEAFKRFYETLLGAKVIVLPSGGA
jgi:hypothetical protein